jgi:hypothetical protein
MAGIPSVKAMAVLSYIQNLLVRKSTLECHRIDCEVHNIQTVPEFDVQSTPEHVSEKQESVKFEFHLSWFSKFEAYLFLVQR